MVALAVESVVDECPAAPEMTVEEKKAQIVTLFAEGKRDYFAGEYEASSEKLGDAAKLSSEVFGEFAAESFEIHLYYGRSLLEIARGEDQLIQTAMTNIPKDDEMNESVNEQVESIDNLSDEQKEEIKEQVDEALQENVDTEAVTTTEAPDSTISTVDVDASSETAKNSETPVDDVSSPTENCEAEASTTNNAEAAAESTEKIEDSTETAECVDSAAEATVDDEETDENEEGNDSDVEDEELTTIQNAWEVLEVARNICDKQEESEKWDLNKAEVLLTLGELSLEDENFKQAIDDLAMCLNLHLKHRKSYDRAIAEVYVITARAHGLNDDFVSAEQYYEKAKDTLEAKLVVLKSEEQTPEAVEEIKTIEELITELRSKVEDAQQSAKQVEEKMNSVREKLGLTKTSLVESQSSEPASDITSMIRRKGKRSADPDTTDDVKKPRNEEAEGNTVAVETA